MTRRLELMAAGLSAVAALVHGLVAPEHLAEWWGYGAFFISATVAQGGYAIVLLLQPWRYDASGEFRAEYGGRVARLIFLAGIFGNAAVIALYLVTRTVGIPFLGPDAGEVEEITALSVLSKVLEVALIAVLVRLLREPLSEAHSPWSSEL